MSVSQTSSGECKVWRNSSALVAPLAPEGLVGAQIAQGPLDPAAAVQHLAWCSEMSGFLLAGLTSQKSVLIDGA